MADSIWRIPAPTTADAALKHLLAEHGWRLTAAEEALAHLVAEHGWQRPPADPMMLTTHALAHGAGPDQADGHLTHEHPVSPAVVNQVV